MPQLFDSRTCSELVALGTNRTASQHYGTAQTKNVTTSSTIQAMHKPARLDVGYAYEAEDGLTSNGNVLTVGRSPGGASSRTEVCGRSWLLLSHMHPRNLFRLTQADEFMRLASLRGQLYLSQELDLDPLVIDPLGCQRSHPYLRSRHAYQTIKAGAMHRRAIIMHQPRQSNHPCLCTKAALLSQSPWS